jgi:solute:Na+ symporter, SSS family
MAALDWIVLCLTLLAIMLYGMYKSRGQKDMAGYFLGDRSMPWYMVMFSVITTQASAITFISAPGQAFTDGMRFVQFYFGMPIALIVVAAVFLPRFHKLNVFTAYQFLEQRFDVKTRALTAMLFLLQRGLSSGLTIYAPALILSSVLGWNIYITNILMGSLVIVYTVSGGTKAVSYTQLQQMFIITAGMFIAGYMVVALLPEDIGFMDALYISGKTGHLNTLTTEFNLDDKYNIWSGLIGGFFLALSYFGTDQSQVGRYLSGKSTEESTRGLLLTGAVKIPMQFLILMIGALLVSFYHFHPTPVFHNTALLEKARTGVQAPALLAIEQEQQVLDQQKNIHARALVQAIDSENTTLETQSTAALNQIQETEKTNRKKTVALLKESIPGADTNDTNYIFLNFVLTWLPAGLIGLLIAVIFSASWSSTASELNALSSTTVVDIYKRLIHKTGSEGHYLNSSKILTVIWGILAIGVAMFAHSLGSMIEAVNVLGSLFYGTVLGIFLTAFFLKQVKGTAVFYAALIAEVTVILLFLSDAMAFLWLNLLGCGLVMGLALLISVIMYLGSKPRNN